MASFKRNNAKEQALERVNAALAQVADYRKALAALQGEDCEIILSVRAKDSKRPVKVSEGLEEENQRIAAALDNVIKKLTKSIRRDTAKFDIELDDSEIALLDGEEETAEKATEPAPKQHKEDEAKPETDEEEFDEDEFEDSSESNNKRSVWNNW